MVFNGNRRHEECARIVLCRIKRCNVITTARFVPLAGEEFGNFPIELSIRQLRLANLFRELSTLPHFLARLVPMSAFKHSKA